MSKKKPIFIRNQEGLPIGCVLEDQISLLPSDYWGGFEDEITVEECEDILESGGCTINIDETQPYTARYLVASLGFMEGAVRFDFDSVLTTFIESDDRIKRSFELNRLSMKESNEHRLLLMEYTIESLYPSYQYLYLVRNDNAYFILATNALSLEYFFECGFDLDEFDEELTNDLDLELYKTETFTNLSVLGDEIINIMSPEIMRHSKLAWGREPAKIPWHEILFALRDDKEYHPVYHELIAYLEEKKLYSENELKKYRGYKKI